MLTGQEYKDSLKDGRKVYFAGRLIEDFATEPALGVPMEVAAAAYDKHYSAEPGAVNPLIDAPRSPEELRDKIPVLLEMDLLLNVTYQSLMTLLVGMSRRPTFAAYFASLPSLGIDGSLATVGRAPPNAVIAPAFGRVFAKTGTTIDATGLKAQNFAGYIDAASGRRLAYVLYVNDVGTVKSVADVIEVFEDEGEISALLRADS